MGGHPADICSVWSTRPEPGRGGLAPAPEEHRDDTEVRLKGQDPSWHRGREDQTAIQPRLVSKPVPIIVSNMF